MSSKVDFLYLDEPSMVKAGVTDMPACIKTIEEVYRLMGQGDYVMSGRNHNSHGAKIVFPDNPPFPNMPKNGPDRRFMAMVATWAAGSTSPARSGTAPTAPTWRRACPAPS